MLSLALHLVVVSAARAIFMNGLDVTASGVHLTGDPRDLARLLVDLGRYVGATAALFGLYVWLLILVGRGHITGRLRLVALAFPVVFHLALLPGRPYFSLDLFTYLAHGAQVVLLGANPYAVPASGIAATPYGMELISHGWRPTIPLTPYGPLWTWIEVAVVAATREVEGGIVLMKVVVASASLGSAALIWSILGRVRPSAQLSGTLAYLWNPLILGELAGEGHNDAVMILLTLASLYAAVRASWTRSALALGLAVAAKFLPAILTPPMAMLVWSAQGDRAARTRRAVTGLVMALAVAVLLFAPYWSGLDTFAGIGAAADSGIAFASTRWALLQLAGPSADAAVRAVLTLAFLAVVVLVSVRVRDAQSALRACAWIALAYVLVATPYFWPWHAALPIALMALRPDGFRLTLVTLGAGSRLAAPLDDMFANGFIPLRAEATMTFILAIGLPLLVLAVAALRNRQTGGTSGPPT